MNIRIPLPELEDVADSCAAKAVQCLVVVPDYGKRRPAAVIREEGDQLLLPVVHVLVLVDEQVTQAGADVFESRGILIEEVEHLVDDAVEV